MHTHPYLLEIRNNFGHKHLYPFSSAVSGAEATAVAREMRQGALSALFSLQPRAYWPEWKNTASPASNQIPYSPLKTEGAVMPFWYLKQDHKSIGLKLSYSIIF